MADRRLATLVSGVPGTLATGGVDPVVTGLSLQDPAELPAPGHLAALTGPVDEALLARYAEAGCPAVLLRSPADEAERAAVVRRCGDLGLGLAWLEVGEPWWPALRALEAAFGHGTPPDDLFALADRIAAGAGGPVIIEDASFRVLAYSAFVGEMDRGRAEAILGRRIPDAWLDHLAGTGSLDRLRSGSAVVDLADGPWRARRRLITAAHAGTRLLAVVWVAEGDRPLPPDAPQALRRAVEAAVPQLLRHIEQVAAEEDRRARLVAALLDGGAAATAAASGLGLPATGSLAVLALRSCAPAPPEGDLVSRLREHVALCGESLRRVAAVSSSGTDVVAVVEVGRRGGETAVGLLQEVVRLAGSGPLAPVQGAASPSGAGVAALPRLRDQALAALAALEPGSGARAVRFDEMEARVLVRSVVSRLDPGARLEALDRLQARDTRTSGDLVPTLRAYLRCSGSATRAAAALGVHVTTVRHRLRHVERVAGISLDDPDVRIACDLVLRTQEA